MEKGKEKQKKYFDRQSRKLKRLSAGDVIRMRCPGDSRWSLGKVIEVMGFRSYLVEVNGRTDIVEIEGIYVRPQSSYLYKPNCPMQMSH
jgi:hypothetical protein